MPFNLSVTCDVGKEHADFLEARLREAWPLVAHPPREVSVAVVDDAAMAALHERFLGVAGPTDVLSFELDHDDAGRVSEGEIVVCLGEATRQATDRGGRVADELLLYAVHGLLHLSGHDDLDAAGYARMHAEEDRILTAIGVGAVFAAAAVACDPPPR